MTTRGVNKTIAAASAACLGIVLVSPLSCSSDTENGHLQSGDAGSGDAGGESATGGMATGQAGASSGGDATGFGGSTGDAGALSGGGTGGASAGGAGGTTGGTGGVVGSGGSTDDTGGSAGEGGSTGGVGGSGGVVGSGGATGGTGGIAATGGSAGALSGGGTGGLSCPAGCIVICQAGICDCDCSSAGGSAGTTGGTGGIVGAGGSTGGAAGSGGATGGTGGSGGVGGTGGATGGAAGTGGFGCERRTDDDEVCREYGYPPRAFFCAAPALPPSSACVIYLPIGSGDGVCCPDEYVTCPDEPPADGSSCSEDISCTWGSHPEPQCRTRGSCSGGTWNVYEPPAYCGEPLLGDDCPAAPGDIATGASCSPGQLVCDYPTGDRCACSDCTVEEPSCGPVGDYTWSCWSPPADCPTYYPNLGSVCDLPADTSCTYTCASIATCSAEGVWMSGGNYCPDCNAPGTPIATPNGSRPVAELRPGDLVYSVHRGELTAVPVTLVRSKPQRNHHVMRVVLESGTTLEISATHPTADGRVLGDLAPGDQLDGVRVVSAELVPYVHSHTYDILPASDTGTYYAGGALIGSTLRSPVQVEAPAAPASR